MFKIESSNLYLYINLIVFKKIFCILRKWDVRELY